MEPVVGEHSMLNQLLIGVLGAVLAIASLPALALDLPDSGSKNFSPAGDTPTHFANESVPVSARTADTTANDWTTEEAAAPVPSVVRPVAAIHPSTGRHGKYASAKHVSGKSRGNSHSTRVAKAHSGKAAGTASAYHVPTQARTASKRPTSVAKTVRVAGAGGTSKSVLPSAAKTNTAKHGKSGARHAGVAVTSPKGG